MTKAIVLLSGGMDSTTLLYKAFKDGLEVEAISFDYGQRHDKEIYHARVIADALGINHFTVNLRSYGQAISGSSALTSGGAAVPEGHYAADNMKATVVPNRNAIMLSLAYGIAVARGFNEVWFAAHAGDHEIYPDCRSDFVQALNATLQLGNLWANPIVRIQAPFVDMSKADIAKLAVQLEVPIERTWSCYNGNAKHCGRCGTCVERLEALHEAGAWDLTPYEDHEFWKKAVRS